MRCYNCMRSVKDGTRFCPYCGKDPSRENALYCLSVGTVLLGRYLVGNVLGEGGFGITYLGLDLTNNQKVAVKEYYPSVCANRSNTDSKTVIPGSGSKEKYYQFGRERFQEEARLLAQFAGVRGIVSVLDFFEGNGTAYIVMEYLEGTTLSDILRERGRLSPIPLLKVMLPLMRALERVHQTGLIHRDISPDNIIMAENGDLTLLDFGSARYSMGEETQSLSVILKPGYAPYEQYSRRGKQGAWTDVYALCATIYKCITGETPPDALDRVVDDEIKKPTDFGISLSCNLECVLIKGMTIFPQYRTQSMRELIEAVEGELYDKEKTLKAEPEDVPPKAGFVMHAVQESSPVQVSINNSIPQKETEKHTYEKNSKSKLVVLFVVLLVVAFMAWLLIFKPFNKNIRGRTDITEVSAGWSYTVGLKSNGTVVATGDNELGQCDIKGWTDIIAVSAGRHHTVGLKKDGTVVATGGNYYGQCSVEGWTDIIVVSAGRSHTVGLKKDGTVVATGYNGDGQCSVEGWTDIIAVSAGRSHTVGLKKDGTVVATGGNYYGQCRVYGWTNVVAVSAGVDYTVGLKKDGTVVATGRNDEGQCNVDGWTDIIAVSAGSWHTVGLKKDGTVVATGDNDKDQCNVDGWTDIIAVSAGNYHTIGLKSNGTVVATGNNDKGQCNVQ